MEDIQYMLKWLYIIFSEDGAGTKKALLMRIDFVEPNWLRLMLLEQLDYYLNFNFIYDVIPLWICLPSMFDVIWGHYSKGLNISLLDIWCWIYKILVGSFLLLLGFNSKQTHVRLLGSYPMLGADSMQA